MKKRLICLSLGLILCLGLGPVGAAEGSGFADVTEGVWFAPYVGVCVEHGLMNGTGDGMFSPSGVLTEAECSTLALRLFMLPRGGDGTLEAAPEEWGYFSLSTADGKTLEGYADRSDLWYYSAHKYAATLPAVRLETEEQRAWAPGLDGTVATLALDGRPIPGTMRYRAKNPGDGYDLCFDPDDPRLAHSLVSAIWSRPGPDKWWRNAAYTAQLWELEGLTFSSQSADRSFFVQTLALAAEGLEAVNSIISLPDTGDEAVLGFYNAGILTGVDAYGTFAGDRTLTRAEAAAMVSRIAEPSLRLPFTPADYSPFLAAHMEPGTVVFDTGVTAEAFLAEVNRRISQAEEGSLRAGHPFNWHYVDANGKTTLENTKASVLENLGVTEKQGTQAYKDFDYQVYYARLIDLTGETLEPDYAVGVGS